MLIGGCERLEETALKMETSCFYETLSSADKFTRRQNLGEQPSRELLSLALFIAFELM
jgi:hypothetical protein